jgi:hypothetical protein
MLGSMENGEKAPGDPVRFVHVSFSAVENGEKNVF